MSSPRPPRQLRAQRTRRELLAGARRIFAQHGYEQATVDQIAQAAGCSKGAYYFHFSSKEETFVALVDAWIEERSRRIRGAASISGLAPQSLAKAVSWQETGWEPELAVEFWSQSRRLAKVGERLRAAYRDWEALLTKALADGQDATSVTDAASTLLALFDGLALQSCLSVTSRDGAGAVPLAAIESITSAARRSRVA